MSGSSEAVNPDEAPETISSGTLLGGRVTYHQFRAGYRTGIEPVLLAAFVPARPGEHVLEGGCGAGAGLLCLHARIGGLYGTGLEADPETADLARVNFRANDAPRLDVMEATLPEMPAALRERAPKPNGRFAHSFANPPWHNPRASISPDARRRLALTAPAEGWTRWVGALARWTSPGGTVSLALPASATDAALEALGAAGCGSVTVFPLWPKAGIAARLVLVRAVPGGRSPLRLSAGLVLHHPNGRFTEEADAVLRHGAALTP